MPEEFEDQEVIALDSEGVDLSRSGNICIVQIATRRKCFLIDVLGKDKDDELITWLRTILASESVVKILHDARMDSDGLLHHLDIELSNVFDTSVYHETISGKGNCSLNNTLLHYDLPTNDNRDCSVYRTNPRFWEIRPLTEEMIQWASEDINGLFNLHDKMKSSAANALLQRASERSMERVTWSRNANVATVEVRNVGRFIGTRGANIQRLTERYSVLFYKRRLVPHDGVFFVYCTSEASLNQVKASANSL